MAGALPGIPCIPFSNSAAVEASVAVVEREAPWLVEELLAGEALAARVAVPWAWAASAWLSWERAARVKEEEPGPE
ncbi:MAG: hypothetical protein JW939_06965 [Candidatus Thermoplasmatota archaeon]|nr:hypothetical protein [Candidatus Thermoplasmatota archaeon]